MHARLMPILRAVRPLPRPPGFVGPCMAEPTSATASTWADRCPGGGSAPTVRHQVVSGTVLPGHNVSEGREARVGCAVPWQGGASPASVESKDAEDPDAATTPLIESRVIRGECSRFVCREDTAKRPYCCGIKDESRGPQARCSRVPGRCQRRMTMLLPIGIRIISRFMSSDNARIGCLIMSHEIALLKRRMAVSGGGIVCRTCIRQQPTRDGNDISASG